MASYLFELSYTLVVIGIIYYFLTRASLKEGAKGLVLHWLCFGFVINFYGLSWLYSVYPLPWMKEGMLQITAIAILHLILSFATAIPYGILALHSVVSFPRRRESIHTEKVHTSTETTKKPLVYDIWKPLFFASLLTIAEIFRALIISLLYYKKGYSTIGLHFTAGTIGNALSTTPLIEFAYFGGTFALTFVLGYLVYIGQSKKHVTLYWKHGAGIFILLLLTHYGVPVTLPQKPLSIGIVTTNTPVPKNPNDYGYSLKEQEKRIHRLTMSLASSSPDFVVYPEDTRYLSSMTPTHKTDMLIAFGNTVFVDGDTLKTDIGFSNISLFFTPKKYETLARGKEFLLPFNEYIPSFFSSLFAFFITEKDMKAYQNMHTYVPYHSPKTVTVNDVHVGTLICSEILSFNTIQSLKKENSQIIFFQAHLQVFHGSPWFDMHLRSFTKVAAAQTRTTLISSASGAPSYTVSPYGTIEFALPAGEGVGRYQVAGSR